MDPRSSELLDAGSAGVEVDDLVDLMLHLVTAAVPIPSSLQTLIPG